VSNVIIKPQGCSTGAGLILTNKYSEGFRASAIMAQRDHDQRRPGGGAGEGIVWRGHVTAAAFRIAGEPRRLHGALAARVQIVLGFSRQATSFPGPLFFRKLYTDHSVTSVNKETGSSTWTKSSDRGARDSPR